MNLSGIERAWPSATEKDTSCPTNSPSNTQACMLVASTLFPDSLVTPTPDSLSIPVVLDAFDEVDDGADDSVRITCLPRGGTTATRSRRMRTRACRCGFESTKAAWPERSGVELPKAPGTNAPVAPAEQAISVSDLVSTETPANSTFYSPHESSWQRS
mmetsp:Transcript_6498/g.13870  ORF Transcript_6498/g.13870 Transcript_6498/m.13870 type:complete len:158 (-) Transcript_6498:90-563(-)